MDYRGRLAPTPSGYLHLGHARTFWLAAERCQQHAGRLVLRQDDLDRSRCRPEYARAAEEDLRWLGIEWQEGPDVGGPYGPYLQSERLELYEQALERLRAAGWLYACTCSRKDIREAQRAPHQGDEEPLYPGTCRERSQPPADRPFCWRFRVPAGRQMEFVDGNLGAQSFCGGADFGDFVVWRDGPSYQLACVVDDAAMRITEVVRGADLLLSTARQLLLYAALDEPPPRFFHADLVVDENGVRLAKRHDALALRTLRAQGRTPADIMASFAVR